MGGGRSGSGSGGGGFGKDDHLQPVLVLTFRSYVFKFHHRCSGTQLYSSPLWHFPFHTFLQIIGGQQQNQQQKHDIFVGNLAFSTTEEQLHQAFSEIGKDVLLLITYTSLATLFLSIVFKSYGCLPHPKLTLCF